MFADHKTRNETIAVILMILFLLAALYLLAGAADACPAPPAGAAGESGTGNGEHDRFLLAPTTENGRAIRGGDRGLRALGARGDDRNGQADPGGAGARGRRTGVCPAAQDPQGAAAIVPASGPAARSGVVEIRPRAANPSR